MEVGKGDHCSLPSPRDDRAPSLGAEEESFGFRQLTEGGVGSLGRAGTLGLLQDRHRLARG